MADLEIALMIFGNFTPSNKHDIGRKWGKLCTVYKSRFGPVSVAWEIIIFVTCTFILLVESIAYAA